MTEIVTTFYSLEGASKGVALERWDSDVLSNTNKKNSFKIFLFIFLTSTLSRILCQDHFLGLKQSLNSSTPMVMGASTKKNFASKIAKQITFFFTFICSFKKTTWLEFFISIIFKGLPWRRQLLPSYSGRSQQIEERTKNLN